MGSESHYERVANPDRSAEPSQDGAVFFDLDRTLIAGSSLSTMVAALGDVGLWVPPIPGLAVAQAISKRLGEDPVSMRIARFGAPLFAGRLTSELEMAGSLAADVLAAKVLPGARSEYERHRQAGRRLVLVSGYPRQLIEPLGKVLEFSDVVASEHAELNGRFRGKLEGRYVWGRPRAEEVAEWAARSQVNLAASWAYSDSRSDLPLLELVGNPVAVRPDAILRIVAKSRGWTIKSFSHAAKPA